MAISTLPSSPAALRDIIRNGEYDTVTAGTRSRLRPGQPGHPARGAGLRLPALLPAQSQALSSHRGRGGGQRGAFHYRARRGHPHRPAKVPRLQGRRAGAGNGQRPRRLARRPRLIPHRLQLHLRDGTAGGGNLHATHRREQQRLHVRHQHAYDACGAVRRPHGGVHAPPLAGRRWSRRCRSRPDSPTPTAAPLHVGDPAFIGIDDLQKPDYGDVVPFKPGEVPVFWACGVTPQAVAMESKPPFMITHSPGAHVHHGRPR